MRTHDQHPIALLRDPDAPSPGGSGPVGAPPSSGRASSMTFARAGAAGGPAGEGSVTDAQAMLDPANQSLADALNILLRLIYIGVMLLGVAYLMSGFRNVKEGERGIRLLFGKVTESDLEPGLRWAPPYPFGQLRVVSQGQQRVDLNQDFWVVTPPNQNVSLDTLPPEQSLNPDQQGAGSLITGDGNLVHARWALTYRRNRASNYARNVLPETEVALVRAAAMRGVVRACAEMPIDELLRQSPGQPNSVSARAREVAQQMLDTADTGILIEQLTLSEITPPLWVRRDFAAVQAASSNAQKAMEDAQTERTGVLNEVAGRAAEPLLGMIAQYELALAQSDAGAAERVLGELDAVMQGQASPGGVTASGRVTKIVSDAQAYRTQVVSAAQSQLGRFEAMNAQFESNPLVMVTRAWSGAVSQLYARDTVRRIFLPPSRPGDIVQVMLNKDPFLERELEKAVKATEAREAAERAAREQQRRMFETTPTETLRGD